MRVIPIGWIALLLVAPWAKAAEAAPTFVDVFTAGAEGFHTYRIPSLLSAADGTVLAFAEARVTQHDHAENKIVLKRSSDAGKTWSPLQVICEDGKNSLNNPCAVLVRETGRVLLIFQRFPQIVDEHTAQPGIDGDKICRNWLITSDDNGRSWSKPEDITATTKRPAGVTSLASGPGIGIQLRRGEHAGRILFPFNQGPYGKWKVYAVFSDDQGKTWSFGETAPDAPKGFGNEVQFVELTEGSLRLNARAQGGNHRRQTAVSKNGGKTWSALADVPDLIEPICAASVLRFSDPADGKKGLLLYSGPDSDKKRADGTIWLSEDDGETWPQKKLLAGGPFAYSVLTRLPGDAVGCLFETGAIGPYEKIAFAVFTMSWLKEK